MTIKTIIVHVPASSRPHLERILNATQISVLPRYNPAQPVVLFLVIRSRTYGIMGIKFGRPAELASKAIGTNSKNSTFR